MKETYSIICRTDNVDDLYGDYILEKRNYQFLENHLEEKVWANIMTYACTRGSFSEVCKAFREISYDQIGYYGDDNHSPIYSDGKHSDTALEQATYLQQKLSTVVDLYEQCITNGREFEWEYLYDRLGR